MCLRADLKQTKQWLKKHKNDETVKVYKVLTYGGIDDDEHTIQSPMYYMKWKPGDIKAINDNGNPVRARRSELKEYKMINTGIHVFLTKKAARQWGACYETIVTLEVRPKDLIAVENDFAVFTKVHLSKANYNRAIKNLKKKQHIK